MESIERYAASRAATYRGVSPPLGGGRPSPRTGRRIDELSARSPTLALRAPLIRMAVSLDADAEVRPSGPWYCPTELRRPIRGRSRACSRRSKRLRTSGFPSSDFHISSLLITEQARHHRANARRPRRGRPRAHAATSPL